MRAISFSLTTEQVRGRTKTVTRRLGWRTLQPGTLLQAIEQGQGLRKGQKVVRLGVIRVLGVRREPLLDFGRHGAEECAREGFPELSVEQFLVHFCATHRCDPATVVTRIEFEHVDGDAVGGGGAGAPRQEPAGGGEEREKRGKRAKREKRK